VQRISAQTVKLKQFRRHKLTQGTVLLLFLLAFTLLSIPVRADTVFFLARHAEKQNVAEDPRLNEDGRLRAARLADLLADAGLTSIHSTDYRRTRETAQAVARRLGLEVKLYDPAEPGKLLDELQEAGGRHLLIGHSNTVPDMVARLGGEPYGAIDEEGEYDRLYIVTLDEGGSASTLLLRYGNPYSR
jgi:phosphohistidine phosphatase SixA